MRTSFLVSVVVFASLGAAACGKDDKGGSGAAGGAAGGGASAGVSGGAEAGGEKGMPPAADCDRLGQRTVAQSMEGTPPGTSEARRRALQALSEEAGRAVAGRCKADGWTRAAVQCGLASKNPGGECAGRLTPEQMRKMTEEVQAIFARGLAAMPPEPEPGSAPGSAPGAPAADGTTGGAPPPATTP